MILRQPAACLPCGGFHENEESLTLRRYTRFVKGRRPGHSVNKTVMIHLDTHCGAHPIRRLQITAGEPSTAHAFIDCVREHRGEIGFHKGFGIIDLVMKKSIRPLMGKAAIQQGLERCTQGLPVVNGVREAWTGSRASGTPPSNRSHHPNMRHPSMSICFRTSNGASAFFPDPTDVEALHAVGRLPRRNVP